MQLWVVWKEISRISSKRASPWDKRKNSWKRLITELITAVAKGLHLTRGTLRSRLECPPDWRLGTPHWLKPPLVRVAPKGVNFPKSGSGGCWGNSGGISALKWVSGHVQVLSPQLCWSQMGHGDMAWAQQALPQEVKALGCGDRRHALGPGPYTS